MKSFNRLYNIVISAVCMGLAQHSFGLGWLAWFCLVPFFISIKENSTIKKTCLDTTIWAFIYHLTSLYWLSENIGVDERYIAFITMLLANLACTFNIILVFIIWHLLNSSYGKKLWYLLPLIWTMVDYLSIFGSISFPWASIANTQAQNSLLPILQFIEITGMFGLTFWIVSLNVALFYLYQERSAYRFIDSLAIFVLPLILGGLISKKVYNENEKIEFAILQPNISINDKRNISTSHAIQDLLEKSENYLSEKNDRILIWPETAFNHYNNQINNQVKTALEGTNINLLSGVYEINENAYNSIYYLNDKNNYSLINAEKYRKIKMVPGAEQVPFSNVFPFLSNMALVGNLTKGLEYKIFDYKDSKFGAMVCIESTFPNLARQFVRNGAEFLVYVANDGWYIKPAEAYQHAKQTIFRAIETRKSILRCGNTGVSWVVSPNGEIVKELEHNSEGLLTSDGIEIYSNSEKTIYLILGDWIAYLSIIVVLFLSLKAVIRKVKK